MGYFSRFRVVCGLKLFVAALVLYGWVILPSRVLGQARAAAASRSATGGMAMSANDVSALRGALEAYDRGNAAAAEPVLRGLAARYPKSYEAQEALGGIYAEAGDAGKALPYLERASRVDPRQALGHANLGAVYLKLNRAGEAVAELQRAAVLEPGNGSTQSNLGQALMATGKPTAAAKAFAVAVKGEPGNWDLRYNWALALFECGDAASASTALRAGLVMGRTDTVESLAGDVAEKLGQFKEAAEFYQSAAKINPSDANLYTLTVEFLRHWTWDQAIQIANYGAQRYPASTHFKTATGIALYGSNKYPEAVGAFSELLAKEPENTFYADLLGRSCSLVAEGASVDCAGLEAFAQRHPENARAAMYAATAILHRPVSGQDMAKVEGLLQQAVASDAKLAEAYYELGVLKQQRSDWKESVGSLEQAIALRPSYPEAHYRLSRAYSHLGMRVEAQKQMALQQQFAQEEKDHLNTRMQEVVTFLLKAN